jgi:hypothetical protein
VGEAAYCYSNLNRHSASPKNTSVYTESSPAVSQPDDLQHLAYPFVEGVSKVLRYVNAKMA